MAKKEDHVCFVYHYYIGMRADNVKQAKKFFFCVYSVVHTYVILQISIWNKIKKIYGNYFLFKYTINESPSSKDFAQKKKFLF